MKHLILLILSLASMQICMSQSQWYYDMLESANEGNSGAMFNLGLAYERGEYGLPMNLEKSIYWYKKAAAQGDAGAQFSLGLYYHNGRGVEQDYFKAVEWYKKAAAQGNANAQCNLGWCYENGRGVEQDYFKAVEWYKKAAAQGNANAFNHLAYCYVNGKGVKQDFSLAIETIDKAIKISPQNANYRDSKGEFYLIKGDNEMALKMWKEAVQLDPNYASEETNLYKGLFGGSIVDKNIPTTNEKNSNTFAIIIANEEYKYECAVPYAFNDGEIFKEYCLKTLGVPDKNVRLVKNATQNEIRYHISWIRDVAQAYQGEAKIIFYYAGHGIPDESNGSAYLLPTDGFGKDPNSGYSLNNLYQMLGESPCKSVLIFLDACFSGTKRDEGMLASARGVAIKVKNGEPKGNMIVLSAAQGDETAYPINEEKHGMFTYFLLKKLQETKGDVTCGDLAKYIQTEVGKKSIVDIGKKQTPNVIVSSSLGNGWTTWKLK